MQLLKLGPKNRVLAGGGKALGFTRPRNLCSWLKFGAGLVCREIQTLCCDRSGCQGLCSRCPLGTPSPSDPPACSLWDTRTRKSQKASHFSPKNNFENESREAESGDVISLLFTFQIRNSLSCLPGRKAICISRGQDVAISFYHLKSVIKSLFGNKARHEWKGAQAQTNASCHPDFPGCCWRMPRRGGTGIAEEGNGTNP